MGWLFVFMLTQVAFMLIQAVINVIVFIEVRDFRARLERLEER